MVALTGIEPADRQVSSVQLGLSRYVFSPVQFATGRSGAIRVAGVVCRWSVGVMRRPDGWARRTTAPYADLTHKIALWDRQSPAASHKDGLATYRPVDCPTLAHFLGLIPFRTAEGTEPCELDW